MSAIRLAYRAFIIEFIAVFGFLLLPSYAQQPASSSAPSPDVVSNVDEVSLDVVAHTKKNKPVPNLMPEDLVVTDNGKVIKISSFRFVTQASGSNRLITLLFDRLDSSAATNARNIASKVMKDVPSEGFSFAVMSVENRLKLYQYFTTDRNAVSEAIRSAADAPRNAASAGDAQAAEKKLTDVARKGQNEKGGRATTDERRDAETVFDGLLASQKIIEEQHTNAALASLLALARTQAKFPGRKVVIFFSQGLRNDPTMDEMLGSIAGAANRSGVSIYAIDTNAFQGDDSLVSAVALGNSVSMQTGRVAAPAALSGPPATPQGDASAPGMHSMVSSQLDRFQHGNVSGGGNPLAQLSDTTAGGWVPAGESPRKAIQAMVRDMTSYYELSYVPPIKDYDGSFHAVDIKPVREGLKLHARAGYFAIPPQDRSAFKIFEAPLLKALSEPQLPSELALQSRVLQLGDLGSADGNSIVVEVPVSELTTRDDVNSNLYTLHASLVAQIKNELGEVIEHFSEDFPRHGALDTKNQFATLTMQRHFSADPGNYTLEAAVVDRISGKIGAARSTFSIAAPEPGPSLSDLAIVQKMVPFPGEVDDDEPLRYGTQRVVPDLSAHLNRGVRQIDLFSIIHAQSSEAAPRLELTVMRNHEPMAQVPLQTRQTSGSVAVPYVASIQSASLPPGDYQLIETLTQGEKSVAKTVNFRIEGPELASVTAPSNPNSISAPSEELSSVTSRLQNESGPHSLVITSLPPGSVPPPSAEELDAIIESARKHALTYSKSLPNFVCLETTSRSVDSSGDGSWKHRDTLAELLRYVDSKETRTMVEINGQKSSATREDLNPDWAISAGEFGSLLNLIFASNSKAEFQWKEAATLGSSTVQVLNYEVHAKNATMSLNDNTRRIGVGFHGMVYIDAATGGVRRVTMEADGIPHDFSIHAASISVDYDYVTIGTHDYLMPMRAATALQRGRHQVDLNEITFRGYRRYASQVKIVTNP